MRREENMKNKKINLTQLWVQTKLNKQKQKLSIENIFCAHFFITQTLFAQQ
jgi:hypothetical protein